MADELTPIRDALIGLQMALVGVEQFENGGFNWQQIADAVEVLRARLRVASDLAAWIDPFELRRIDDWLDELTELYHLSDDDGLIGPPLPNTMRELKRLIWLFEDAASPHRQSSDATVTTLSDDEAEATKPTGPPSKSGQPLRWLAEAMLLVRDHPDWSNAEIARQVGKHPSTLSRSREYQAAAAMARGVKDNRHRGHVSVDPDSSSRDVVAYSDDPADRDWDD